VGRINDIPTAAELVKRMVREAEAALRGGVAAFSE
jgi:cell division ATPase FtsA